MAEILVQCVLDFAPPCEQGRTQGFQVRATLDKCGRAIAQKGRALEGENVVGHFVCPYRAYRVHAYLLC